MGSSNYNSVLNNDVLEDNIFNILDPIITRIGIENRRQQGVLERLKEQYQKTKVEEFLGGIKSTESAMKLIDRQVQNITKLSAAIDKLKSANENNFNVIANEINVAFSNLCSFYGNSKWALTDTEKQSLSAAIANMANNYKKKLAPQSNVNSQNNTNSRGSTNLNNTTNLQRDTSSVKNSKINIQKNNPLRAVLGKFGIKKKNDDIIMVDYNYPSMRK